MERDNSRKRTRNEDDEKKLEYHKVKKLETMSFLDQDPSNSYREMGYEFRDAIGVFDFPWLKEGTATVFGVDEYLDPQDFFSPYSYAGDHIQDNTYVANLDQSCVQNSLVDQDFHDYKFDGDVLSSFQVDDLEPLDCILSCVIDEQPTADNFICVNKAPS